MSGNLENLGTLRLRIFGQGDATLVQADNMTAVRIHLTDYRRKERNPDRLHLAKAIGEIAALVDFLDTAASGNTEPDRLAEIASEILARINQGEITQ